MSTKKPYTIKIKKIPPSFRARNAKYSISWELHPIIGSRLMNFLKLKGRSKLQRAGFFKTKKEAERLLKQFFKENKEFKKFVKVVK